MNTHTLWRAAILAALLGAALPVGASTDPHVWQSIGPTSIDGGDVDYGWAAGRVTDMLVTDDGTRWIATANGGIWYRGPEGDGWNESNKNLTTLAFGAIDHFGSTFYAASGEDNGDCIDCGRGQGLFRSTDGGHSWSAMSASTSASRSAFIRVGSADGKVIWAGGEYGLIESTDGGDTWSAPLQRPDPGTGDLQPFENPRAIAVLPDYHATLVADETGIFRFTNGQGWTALPLNPVAPLQDPQNGYAGTQMAGAMAVTAANPHEILVGFTVDNTNYDHGCKAGIYLSTDDGDTWKELSRLSGDPYATNAYYKLVQDTGCQGWYDNAVAISPTDPKTLVVAGITLDLSTDGGQAWSDLESSSSEHPDVHTIAFDPSGKTFYVGEDGGVIEYSSDGTTAQNLNQDLSIAEFYGSAGTMADGSVVIGGMQDNGTARIANPLQDVGGVPPSPCPSSTPEPAAGWPKLGWKSILSGDGGEVLIDPRNPQDVYAEYVQGALQSSTDGGCTFNSIAPPVQHAAWVMPYATSDDWNFVVAGGDDVYLTLTGGVGAPGAEGADTWKPQKAFTPPSNATTNVTALWVSHDGQVIVAGRSDDKGLTPPRLAKRFTIGGPWQNEDVSDATFIDSVIVDPKNSNHAFLATEFSQPPSCSIRETMNFASPTPQWSHIEANLRNPTPSDPNSGDNCMSSTLSLFNGRLYAGTSRGVFVYVPTPAPAHWEPVGQDLPIVPVVSLNFVAPNSLIVFTHGRGAWYLPQINP